MISHIKVTISGSYRKFPEKLGYAIQEFRDLGAVVLSPKTGYVLREHKGFVTLQGDLAERIDTLSESTQDKAVLAIENSHLAAISQSDIMWIILENGYCGDSTAMEMGFALAHGVPVYAQKDQIELSDISILHKYAMPAEGIADAVRDYWGMSEIVKEFSS